MKSWIFKGVLPLLLIAFLLFFFKGAYMVDGKIDWFWLWMCVGAPFGIVHLAVFVIPVNMDITSSLGVLFAHLAISGLLGGFIAVWTAVKAIYYLMAYPFVKLYSMPYMDNCRYTVTTWYYAIPEINVRLYPLAVS